MAKEKWTVLFDYKDAGNIAPAQWTEKQVKVSKIGAGTALEKNEGWNLEPAGVLKSAEVQSGKFVTVVAESAEEACLAVQKFYGTGISPNGAELTGPKTSQFTNGKMSAALSANLTEVSVVG